VPDGESVEGSEDRNGADDGRAKQIGADHQATAIDAIDPGAEWESEEEIRYEGGSGGKRVYEKG